MERADRRIDYQAFAIAVLAVGIFWGLYVHWLLWQLEPSGVSPVSEKLAYWDFSNLWAGGRLALSGDVQVLFDIDSYRDTLRRWFGSDIADQEWSYPPSILLIGAPLALLPMSVAYALWTIGSISCLYWACRICGLPRGLSVAVCLSPAVFFNALFGQNGSLNAALLIAGLAMVDRRPLLSGILIGLLSIKPHLGILLPFCLLAGGYRLPFAAAAATCIAMVIATGLLFGFDAWQGFWSVTRPLMTEILEAPFPQGYHANAATLFALVRSLEGSLATAYAVQFTATLAAIFAAIRLWRSNTTNPQLRVMLTATLTLIATPYGYLYDAVPVAAGIALIVNQQQERNILAVVALSALWFMPLLARFMLQFGINTGVLFILVAIVALFAASKLNRVSSLFPAAIPKAS